MARYKQVSHNEWQQPARRNYKMACCDCGLVHLVDFRIKGGRIQLRARRAVRHTAALRSHMRRRGEPSIARSVLLDRCDPEVIVRDFNAGVPFSKLRARLRDLLARVPL